MLFPVFNTQTVKQTIGDDKKMCRKIKFVMHRFQLEPNKCPISTVIMPNRTLVNFCPGRGADDNWWGFPNDILSLELNL